MDALTRAKPPRLSPRLCRCSQEAIACGRYISSAPLRRLLVVRPRQVELAVAITARSIIITKAAAGHPEVIEVANR